jgi:hypothetical protein
MPEIDDLVKSLKIPFFVIPAEAGIQYFQIFTNSLDSGFHRSDDFLEAIKIRAKKGHNLPKKIMPSYSSECKACFQETLTSFSRSSAAPPTL